jgi:transposase
LCKGWKKGCVSLSVLKFEFEIKEREIMNENIMYIGIDVSKDKHDICIKNNNGNVLKQFQIRNNQKDLDKLYTTVNKLKSDSGDDIVYFGMEATGIYSLPLYSALKRDGHLVKQYNPIQTNGYRKIRIRKTKTDSIDSAIIADMLRLQEPPVSTAIDNLKLYQLRELCRVRQRNIEKRTKCKIQLENINCTFKEIFSSLGSSCRTV